MNTEGLHHAQRFYEEAQDQGDAETARLLHDLLLRLQTVGPAAPARRTVEYSSWEELAQLRGRHSVSKWTQSNRPNVLTKRPAGAVQGEEETRPFICPSTRRHAGPAWISRSWTRGFSRSCARRWTTIY